MAKLGFRKLNLSWRLSLEVLSLLGSSEHCIGYRSAYKSVLCVLEPIIKPFWAPRASFTGRAWQPLLSRVLHQQEDGEGVLKPIKLKC